MQTTMLPQQGFFTGVRRTVADAVFPEGKERREQAERLANVDALTGLANRRAFDLAQATAEADKNVVVILFDANNFGKVNKLLGYHIGDSILKNMAAVLRLAAARFQLEERVFRLGGDEFVILAPTYLADAIRDLAESMYMPDCMPDGSHISLSGTIGKTLEEADSLLQTRKTERKAQD